MISAARRSLAAALDVIWPPSAPITGERVHAPGALGAASWSRLPFIAGPVCERCGAPRGSWLDDEICLDCTMCPPVWGRARAALAYGPVSRDLVLALKRAGRRDSLPAFAGWMAQAAPFAADADLIAPIPLHWTRLAMRGFNQSVWLAAALARRIGRPLAPDLLTRRRRTPSQAGLGPEARYSNVAGAFAASAQARGRKVVVVDDVLTTGATAAGCAQALMGAGAASVDVVTLARVVHHGPVESDGAAPI
jgi:ComF family protein